jgi:hypothetical protein
VVIRNLDVERIAGGKAKADAPLIIDRNRMLPESVLPNQQSLYHVSDKLVPRTARPAGRKDQLLARLSETRSG